MLNQQYIIEFMLSETQILQVKKLRSQGRSISEIALELSIPRSTIQRYTNSVKIEDQFLGNWKSKRGGSTARRIKLEKKMNDQATRDTKSLTNNEKLILVSALYWGEGNKKDLMITNSDPGIIKVFVDSILELFNVKIEDIQVNLRIFEDMDPIKCQYYWSNVIGITPNSIKSITILSGKKSGKLEYGMCRVRVRKGGLILARIKGINKVLSQKYLNKKYNRTVAPVVQRIEQARPKGLM